MWIILLFIVLIDVYIGKITKSYLFSIVYSWKPIILIGGNEFGLLWISNK
jgi:hypothetical protein